MSSRRTSRPLPAPMATRRQARSSIGPPGGEPAGEIRAGREQHESGQHEQAQAESSCGSANDISHEAGARQTYHDGIGRGARFDGHVTQDAVEIVLRLSCRHAFGKPTHHPGVRGVRIIEPGLPPRSAPASHHRHPDSRTVEDLGPRNPAGATPRTV